MYDFADQQQLDVDTLIRENGAAQLEINFNHGDPLAMAIRCSSLSAPSEKAALQHVRHLYGEAHAAEPGSALHIHQSVIDLVGQKYFCHGRREAESGDDGVHGRLAALYPGAH